MTYLRKTMVCCFGPLLLVVTILSNRANAAGGEAKLLELQQKVELDVLELRHVVEQAYKMRCNPSILRRCHQGNYHACDSAFPNAICLAEGASQFDVCAGTDGANSCGTRWDYSVSTIRFPPSSFSFSSTSRLNQLDPGVIEDICCSQELDEYFVEKRERDEAYWSHWGINSPWMHFGASSGAFRIYPARPQQDGCDDYDPRLRPWYVAGSSGPKNVVLVLDTSGSMEGLRLSYLKQAASRIVDTLTIGDRVALVSFATAARAERIEGRSLVKVTASAKQILKERIDSLEAVGSTNIYDAFRRAFEVMEEAIPQELVVRCNTAFLFLTDGEMTDPPDITEAMVLDLVQNGLAKLEGRLSQPIYLYTFSIAENGDVHHFPKQLACSASTNGVWSKLVDDRTIVESLASYTNLFSMGLGEGRNEDFTAWVEPYTFSTNGELGVTVSAPAFDRSAEPPMLIGVVGVDLPMSALDRALGVELGSSHTLDRVVQASTAKCPRLEITACQLEDFRALGVAGEEARCGEDNCTAAGNAKNDLHRRLLPPPRLDPKAKNPNSASTAALTNPLTCQNREDFPTDVLANRDFQYVPFAERACCNANASSFLSDIEFFIKHDDACVPQQSLATTKFNSGTSETGFIAGMVATVVTLLGLCVAMGVVWWLRRHPPKQERSKEPEPVAETAEAVVVTKICVLDPPPASAPMEYAKP